MTSIQNFFIKEGYVSREKPHYFVDSQPPGMVWQPTVYPYAAKIAEGLGCNRIVDVGCGHGGKLVELGGKFSLVGIDFGANIKYCKETHSIGTWLEADLGLEATDIPADLVAGSVVICSDVVEHIPDPYVLLRKLKKMMDDGAEAVVLSTPCRDATYGKEHNGPPPNGCHCREWSIGEFGVLMTHVGLPPTELFLTESNNRSTRKATIMAVSCGEKH